MRVKDMFPPGLTDREAVQTYCSALRAEASDHSELGIIWQGRDSSVHPNKQLCWDCGCYHEPWRDCVYLQPTPKDPQPKGPNPYADTLRDMIANIRERESDE